MSKLKTLNEINPTGITGCLRCESIGEACGMCDRKELKAEAVKWVKTEKRILRVIKGYKQERIGTGGDFNWVTNPITKDIELTREVREVLKHIFNLTEEDLK